MAFNLCTLLLALFALTIPPTLVAQSEIPDSVADPGPSCLWSCPSHDRNGKSLITANSEFPPFTSPYSIFNCAYALRGPLVFPRPCQYYKKSGELALGGATSDCPDLAAQTCSASDTNAPAMPNTQSVEVMPWIERGGHLLWYLANPIHKRDLEGLN